jgi:hypothetical protein
MLLATVMLRKPGLKRLRTVLCIYPGLFNFYGKRGRDAGVRKNRLRSLVIRNVTARSQPRSQIRMCHNNLRVGGDNGLLMELIATLLRSDWTIALSTMDEQ